MTKEYKQMLGNIFGNIYESETYFHTRQDFDEQARSLIGHFGDAGNDTARFKQELLTQIEAKLGDDSNYFNRNQLLRALLFATVGTLSSDDPKSKQKIIMDRIKQEYGANIAGRVFEAMGFMGLKEEAPQPTAIARGQVDRSEQDEASRQQSGATSGGKVNTPAAEDASRHNSGATSGGKVNSPAAEDASSHSSSSSSSSSSLVSQGPTLRVVSKSSIGRSEDEKDSVRAKEWEEIGKSFEARELRPEFGGKDNRSCCNDCCMKVAVLAIVVFGAMLSLKIANNV